MPLIFTGDGTPTFIPTQRRHRTRSPVARVASGTPFRTPFGWSVRYADGTTAETIVQRAKAKHVKVHIDPRSGETLRVTRPSRRRMKMRKVFTKYILNPYVLGAFTGFGLPKLLSTSATTLLGTGIGVAGYFAPSDSYIRKFSIGSAAGAGLHAAMTHGDVIKEVLETAETIYDVAKPAVSVVASVWSNKLAVLGGALGFPGGKLGVALGALLGGTAYTPLTTRQSFKKAIHKEIGKKARRRGVEALRDNIGRVTNLRWPF